MPEHIKTYSLERSAMLSFLWPGILALTVTLIAIYFSAGATISRLNDEQMVQLAYTLKTLTLHEAVEGENLGQTLGRNVATLGGKPETMLGYRIWSQGQLVTESDGSLRLGQKAKGAGFDVRTSRGRSWRLFALVDSQTGITVEVAQDMALRQRLTAGVMLSVVVPLVALVPLLIVLLLRGLRRAIDPITVLSRDVNSRGGDNLSTLQARIVPTEILPVFTALNNLLARMRDTFAREREFTDNAAHELRTPLAALKTRAQVLSRQVRSGPARTSVDELLTISNRMTRLVEQLLSLARMQGQPLRLDTVSLPDVLSSVRDEVDAELRMRDQTLKVDMSQASVFSGDPVAIAILIRNLLENASRYSPNGSEILISASSSGGGAILRVADNGPGITEGDRSKALMRFTRLDTSTTGSGLGLSIVKSICDKHGAKLTLKENMPNGLVVEIVFGQG